MTQAVLEQDERYMRLALELAGTAKGETFPNPAVGAVVVRNGKIVGKGRTGRCGGPHAEVCALRDAGARARGATLYTTLEPCCHHGRTPPCTDAIALAGVARVVTAVRDPNPLVCGKGLRALQRQGVAVRTGVLREDAARLNEDFFWWITRGRPWVTLKLAVTLDGRIADHTGRSRWITGKEARRMVHDLRRRHAAVAVGKNTLMADDPELTVRLVPACCSPARVVFASSPSLPSRLKFVKNSSAHRSIVVCPGGPGATKRRGRGGLEVWHTGVRGRAAMVRRFLHMAGNEGLVSILVEGGSALASAMLESRLVNRLWLIYGNKVLGGGLDAIRLGRGLPLTEAVTLDRIERVVLGEDFAVTGLPVWQPR